MKRRVLGNGETHFMNQYVRPFVLRRDGFKCTVCSSTKSLDMHHKTYDNPKASDIVLLCRKCHQDEHERLKSCSHFHGKERQDG